MAPKSYPQQGGEFVEQPDGTIVPLGAPTDAPASPAAPAAPAPQE